MIKQISSKLYDQKYFLEKNWGHSSFKKFKGRRLSSGHKFAVNLAYTSKNKIIQKVLDYGCGRGEIVYYFSNKGILSIGVDYSTDAISICKNTYRFNKNLKWHLIKGHKLPFKENYFDIIFFLDVIEHIYDEELLKILSEFKRVLKPGGQIIIHTNPNKLYLDIGYKIFTKKILKLTNLLLFFIKKKLNVFDDGRSETDKRMHVNEQTLKNCEKLFKKIGFSNIKIFYNNIYSIKSFQNFILDFLFRPFWIPFFKKYFSNNIWEIITK